MRKVLYRSDTRKGSRETANGRYGEENAEMVRNSMGEGQPQVKFLSGCSEYD